MGPSALRFDVRQRTLARARANAAGSQARVDAEIDRTVVFCLEPNEVLFVDSSHAARTGNDVNYVFFDILPRLAPGVDMHFHDILHPFDRFLLGFFQERRIDCRRGAYSELAGFARTHVRNRSRRLALRGH
jgi:hypothetical protein